MTIRTGNKILDRLPEPDFEDIVSQMERVTPELREIVAHPGTEPKWVHFPVSGVLSSMVVLENGETVEASTIGNEGMDGLYLLADPLANPYRINVQVQGDMFRISAAAFRRARTESAALSKLLLRYALVLVQRGAQNAACIQHHTIEERMCRWLLETALRKNADQFCVTQEFRRTPAERESHRTRSSGRKTDRVPPRRPDDPRPAGVGGNVL